MPQRNTLRLLALLPITRFGSVLWWSIRGSNPGPQRLQFEGITTILYLRFRNDALAALLAIVLTLLALGFAGFNLVAMI